MGCGRGLEQNWEWGCGYGAVGGASWKGCGCCGRGYEARGGVRGAKRHGIGGVASAEAGPGERWAGPGEKWVGPALWGRGQDDPPTHTQVEELSGQRAAAALQVERWQRECRSLQERFEALSQEREVRPPSPRPPHLQDPPHPPLHPLWFPVPVPEAAGGARCSARGQRGAALCSGAAELLAAGR